MKDFLGNELQVNDIVVMVLPGYRELVKAKIVRFTEHFVFLTYSLNKANPAPKAEVKQTGDQLVKVPN